MPRRGITLLGSIALVAAAASPVHAAVAVWDGGGTGNNWSTANNWATIFGPPRAPADDGTADIFMNASSKLLSNVDMSWNINSLSFNHGPFDITGSTLTISFDPSPPLEVKGITNAVNLSQRIRNNVVLGSHQTWDITTGSLRVDGTIEDARGVGERTNLTVTGAGDTTLAGSIGGEIGIIKTGSGTLFLQSLAPNTYSGPTTVLEGELELGNSANVPGQLTIGSDSGAAARVHSRHAEKLSQNPGDVILVRKTGHLSVSDTETLHQLDISGGNVSVGGSLQVNGDVRFLSSGGSISASEGDIQGNLLMSGSTITVTGDGAMTLRGSLTTAPDAMTSVIRGNFGTSAPGAEFNVANGDAATDLEMVGWWYAGTATKVGAGTMKLSGNTENALRMSVNEGTLVLAKPGRAVQSLTIGDGAGGDGADVVRLEQHFQIDASPSVSTALRIQSSGLLDLNGFTDTLYDVIIAGGAITTGAGRLTLRSNVSATSVALPARVSGAMNLTAGDHRFSVADGPNAEDLVLSTAITWDPLESTCRHASLSIL